MKTPLLAALGLTLAGIVTAPASHAATLFSEDAEGGNLNQWVGQFGGSHHGVIVDDPLRPGNKVITFTGLNLGGDIFTSAAINLPNGDAFQVSFEYLGLPTPNSVPHDTGGFFGLSENFPGNHMWYYGTSTLYAAPGYSDMLIDDGTWHTYTFDFVPPLSGLNNDLHLMFEDWVDSGGVAGDAYFDNIVLRSVTPGIVPEASTWVAGLTIGIGAIGAGLRRRLIGGRSPRS
ncbi:MAG: hypothetical protein AB7O66_00020 [Limisphaerales bacterium]